MMANGRDLRQSARANVIILTYIAAILTAAFVLWLVLR